MRTLGLLGGLSWHSTVEYYRLLNLGVEQALGNYHSAPLLLSSVDFGPVVSHQLAGRWDELGELLAERARGLERAGAEAIVICSNTMHKVAPAVDKAVEIPLLHMAQALAEPLKTAGHETVTLLGTRYTMKQPFLLDALAGEGIAAKPPEPADAKSINSAIFKNLVHGQVTAEDQALLNRIIETEVGKGVQRVILGCTEIAMLVTDQTPKSLILDSTQAHAAFALKFILDR